MGSKSASPGAAPAQQPAVNQQQPAVNQQQSAFNQQQPAFNQQQPAFNQQQPYNSYGQQQPYNPYGQQQFFPQQSPFNQQQFFPQQSPFNQQQFFPQRSQFNSQQNPFAFLANPVIQNALRTALQLPQVNNNVNPSLIPQPRTRTPSEFMAPVLASQGQSNAPPISQSPPGIRASQPMPIPLAPQNDPNSLPVTQPVTTRISPLVGDALAIAKSTKDNRPQPYGMDSTPQPGARTPGEFMAPVMGKPRSAPPMQPPMVTNQGPGSGLAPQPGARTPGEFMAPVLGKQRPPISSPTPQPGARTPGAFMAPVLASTRR
jgi:hypothetical protein